jgi:hypothetical protein
VICDAALAVAACTAAVLEFVADTSPCDVGGVVLDTMVVLPLAATTVTFNRTWPLGSGMANWGDAWDLITANVCS